MSTAERDAVPRFVFSHFLTRLGDAPGKPRATPKTALTRLAGAFDVPTWISALLVPLRESGSMLLPIGTWASSSVYRTRKHPSAPPERPACCWPQPPRCLLRAG